ncbi:MAG: succinate dehydrogenase assembly factor 2 [Sulfitobacter sp.]
MTELREHRVKRLAMRSMRRGIKEMDLILSSFADGNLAAMDEAALDHYEVLLEESDHDLYAWVSGKQPTPPQYAALIGEISEQFQPLKR